ncbi:uncharacterized protein CTRU02_215543 [Colletotrichum truncatum]|uniref:Uncharacterized protein n=1 Tax=Colletotrichum truncatum TaxID=5467 RepID=A0ACC3YC19_COLTU
MRKRPEDNHDETSHEETIHVRSQDSDCDSNGVHNGANNGVKNGGNTVEDDFYHILESDDGRTSDGDDDEIPDTVSQNALNVFSLTQPSRNSVEDAPVDDMPSRVATILSQPARTLPTTTLMPQAALKMRRDLLRSEPSKTKMGGNWSKNRFHRREAEMGT